MCCLTQLYCSLVYVFVTNGWDPDLYIPQVSPMHRVQSLNSLLQILISAALGLDLDTLNPLVLLRDPRAQQWPQYHGECISLLLLAFSRCIYVWIWHMISCYSICFLGWFEIFPYLSFGGYNKDRFWHIVAVCRTTSLRPVFVDSADFFRKM